MKRKNKKSKLVSRKHETPTPDIRITTNLVSDKETGTNHMNVIIEAEVEGFTNGFLFLDELQHILLLKNAVDKFIESLNIKPENFS